MEVRWLNFAAFAMCFASCVVSQRLNRRLTTEIICPSQNCSSLSHNDSNINVAYTKADGEHDRLHYVYSTFGAPTVLVAKTSRSSELKINLTRFLSMNVTDRARSLMFTNDAPDAALAIVFTKLIEFNDAGNSGVMPENTTLWRTYNLVHASWGNSSSESNVASNIVQFRMFLQENGSVSENGEGSNNHSDGFVVFKFQAFAADGTNDELPHLHYNANITQIYVTLDGLATTFPHPRFALEMVAVTGNGTEDKNMMISDVKSIDDETTPGAFHIINWARTSSDGVYLQWKPMCYTQRSKAINNARYAKHYGPHNVTLSESEAYLAYAYFGNVRDVFANVTRISFGETDDKFYTATKYSTWALNVGYGTPLEESVSLLVILIVAIGLGIPLLLIIIGGIYVLVRKYRRRRVIGYEDLTSSYPPIGT